jgi:hypothetical protein
MLPPTFGKLDKENLIEPINKIWSLSKNSLVCADRIIIIGYSLPENDLHFKLFFRNALIENLSQIDKKQDLRVEIVNFLPYSTNREIFEEKYREIFDSVNNSQKGERRIVPNFIYKKFSDYIIEDLHKYINTEISRRNV